jgi:CBS domain-containing protein
MSLDAYRHARIIVQSARASVFEAARAMETNEIGCVIVAGANGEIVGVLTDRDIVLRVVGEARDARATALGDVMSRAVATLSPGAATGDALRLMRERRIRRVPLVEKRRAVGMVTIDDLLFDEAAPLADIAEVLRAQMIEAGPARTRRFDEWQSSTRRYARADATRTKLVAAVQNEARLESRERAEKALWIVLVAMIRTLTVAQANRFMAQLPALYRTRLAELPPGPKAAITRERVDAEMARELDVDDARASAVVERVGRALARSTRLRVDLRRRRPRRSATSAQPT